MTSYQLENVNTSCQKAGVPGFPGCVEHSSVIWERIQRVKREKTDLHVVWLDAYRSVPHQLINFTTEFFHMPETIRSPVSSYFNNLRMGFTLLEYTTGWQQLELGIAMGCSISPILFVATFEMILIGARQMVGGMRLPCLPRNCPW